MPTDTIYGLAGNALNEEVVKRIYDIKKRNFKKPCIILIGNINELKKFSIILSEKQKKEIKKFWPGPVSIIFELAKSNNTQNKFLEYLHRGSNTLSFRLPNLADLQNLLLKVGPLISTSANPEGLPPAQNIIEAKKYFAKDNQDLADLYVNGGILKNKASNIIKLEKDGSIKIIRD